MAIRGRWTIPLSKIPQNVTIHRFILQNTDLYSKIELFKNHSFESHLSAPLKLDVSALQSSVKEACEKFGLFNFVYNNEVKDAKSYVSSSLTWNPDATDKISENPHMATLGSVKLKFGSASQYEDSPSGRNTYDDTFAFIEKTEFSQFGKIKGLVDSFDRTLIRSRVSTILAGMEEATRFDYCWHNDESVFVNLRVNIPIQTTPNYVIQIIADASADEVDIQEFDLVVGNAYVYDTNKYHRPFCKKLDTIDRVNMICGVSPWFDFDKESQSWVSNEFFGEIHPFEMFKEGYISSLIKSK